MSILKNLVRFTQQILIACRIEDCNSFSAITRHSWLSSLLWFVFLPDSGDLELWLNIHTRPKGDPLFCKKHSLCSQFAIWMVVLDQCLFFVNFWLYHFNIPKTETLWHISFHHFVISPFCHFAISCFKHALKSEFFSPYSLKVRGGSQMTQNICSLGKAEQRIPANERQFLFV